MNESYIDECKQIQQNATYSAETHHRMAARDRRLSTWLQVVPAIIAAVTSGLVASGVSPSSLLWLTVTAAAISAVASIWNPQKSYQDNLAAAKGFTTMKHDARFLHESQRASMTDAEFRLAVQHLHDKYNEFIKVVPATDQKSFDEAQQVIQAGTHEPDKDSDGRIK
jgi:hypothetical protein